GISIPLIPKALINRDDSEGKERRETGGDVRSHALWCWVWFWCAVRGKSGDGNEGKSGEGETRVLLRVQEVGEEREEVPWLGLVSLYWEKRGREEDRLAAKRDAWPVFAWFPSGSQGVLRRAGR
ncbi:hypothetical protein HAX54_014337, partial [Datura stramonium]|nr:hypothetical protein [Datura stramonium]